MKLTQEISLVFLLTFASPSFALNKDQALELGPLAQTAWGNDWAGGCWFHKQLDANGGAGELMLLIRGEGKGSVAVINLDGNLNEIPYSRTIAKSRRFQIGARDTYLYQAKNLKVQVTTIVTEVPQGNECAGDCSESSGFAAEVNIQAGPLKRKYKFNTGACGL